MKYKTILCAQLMLLAPFAYTQQLPIKPARTITFPTDEGSYMNISISGDGKTLAFDLLGDLYRVPVTGGRATQLTRGLALNLEPSISPDGRKIAYYSDRTGDFRLTVTDLVTNETITLDPTQYHSDQRLLWTPDGKSVILGSTAYGINGINYEMTKNDVLGFSADSEVAYFRSADTLYGQELGGRKLILTGKLPAKSFQAEEISPDGRWFSYVVDSAGSKRFVLTSLKDNNTQVPIRHLQKTGILSGYTFSPDSRSVFIAYGGKIHQVDIESGTDRVIPFTANVKADLGVLDYHTFRVTHDPFDIKYTRSATASPDGKKLVFNALNHIYIKDLPNGKPKILVQQNINQFQPCWSPNGKWIAYVSWCDTSGGYLWKVPASGGQPLKLTPVSGQYQRPCWSPDGKSIAVIKGAPHLGERDDQGIGQLQLVNAEKQNIRALADSLPLWNQLSFSNDGRILYYQPPLDHSPPTPAPALRSLDLQTGQSKTVAVIAPGRYQNLIQERLLSPDGRYLVFTLDEHLYLVPVSRSGNPLTNIYDPQHQAAVRFCKGLDPHWEQGGKVLSWVYGNRFYRIAPEKVIAAGNNAENIHPESAISLNVIGQTAYARGTIVLKNVRVITMRSDKVIEHGTIIIQNGRFRAIETTGAIPPKAKVIDLTGKTIVPGFIDLHLHMYTPTNVLPQQSWMYLVNLAFGTTTARDPSSSYDSFGYSELLRAGQMTGPRLFSSGRPVRFGDGVSRFNDLPDAKDVVAQRKMLGGIFIKQYTLPTRIDREWLLLASNESGLNMTNEGGTMGWPQLLGMIKDGGTGVEHNADWNDVHRDVIQFIARSRTCFTPTLQVTPVPGAKQYFNHCFWHTPNPKLQRFMPSDDAFGPTANGHESYDWITKGHPEDTTTEGFLYAAQVDARIRHAGGLVTVGSHGNDEGIGVHNEIWALQMGGVTNMEALQSATILAARGLGVQQDIGSIEPGKIADLIILNSNPLDDIHNTRDIKYVMKDGILYDGDTLDELWPVKKKCPEWRLKTNDTNGK